MHEAFWRDCKKNLLPDKKESVISRVLLQQAIVRCCFLLPESHQPEVFHLHLLNIH